MNSKMHRSMRVRIRITWSSHNVCKKERLRQWLLDHGKVLPEEHIDSMRPLPERALAVYTMASDGGYLFGYIARSVRGCLLSPKHPKGWIIPDMPRHWWVRTMEEVPLCFWWEEG